MDAFIILSDARRRELCEEAGAQLGLDPASVEKDFWVCWTLRELFSLPGIGAQLTFKGGTSLAKGWRLIERFSEDIDVVIDRAFLGFGGDLSPERAASRKQRDQRLDALKAACSSAVQDAIASALAQRIGSRLTARQWSLAADPQDPDGQTLLFHYPAALGAGGYVVQSVKIELGARSDTDPCAMPEIQPYVAEALPRAVPDARFCVRAVAPERTFWEKASLLHEETFRAGGKGPAARLARHYYDLWCLIRAGVAERARADAELFERVAAHRRVFFRKSREAQDSLRRGALRLLPGAGQFGAWARDYEAMRESMIIGAAPTFDEILEVVAEFERQFNAGVQSPPS